MNRTKYILISIVLLTGFFSSCSMEEMVEPVIAPEAVADLPDSVFFILEGSGPQTRVTYAGDGIHADFEKEDLVGCFALSEGLATAVDGVKQNACYRVSVHTNIGSGEDRRFLAPMTAADDLPKDAAGYMFYYPYNPDIESLDELKSYAHTVKSDQNDRDRYEASDLLWDICVPTVSGDDRYVEVDMDHAMAQIIVEVESDLIADKTVPTLLNVPLTVSPIDLVKPSLDGMTEDMGEEGSYVLGQERSSIEMWEFGYATSGNLMFRAVIPANHSFAHGSVVVQLTDKETGNPKRFRINASMDFEPGKTYRMTLVKEKDIVAPDEVDDDETWVYDVLDPETMEPVGLLCKEYLHFQPGNTYQNKDVETGVPYTGGVEPTKYISSQAWVLYKNNMTTGVPDLNTGYVLRFINDVKLRGGSATLEAAYWPLPHLGFHDTVGGLFTPSHGHDWTWTTDKDGYKYGVQTETYTDYYMHGGVIQWDGSQNVISWFSLPYTESEPDPEAENVVTNEEVKQGHVAIDDNGVPFLCYHPITENPPHKIALLSPHYLIDRRISKSRTVEERMYPLVKIGYNQFWMSRSLRAATQIDGTPLSNYNSADSLNPGLNLPNNLSEGGAGYIYVASKLSNTEVVDGVTYTYYDPYNQYDADEREDYLISPMYNAKALDGSGMLPTSTFTSSKYYMPTKAAVMSLMTYLGWSAGKKIITRQSRTRFTNNQQYIETEYEALRSGKFTNMGANSYSANICGLDLRAEGYYKQAALVNVGGDGAFHIEDENKTDNQYVYMFCLPFYLVFQPSTDNQPPENQFYYNDPYDLPRKVDCFAPLRFFMKFDGQADTGGVSVSSMGLATRSASSAPVEDRDVYVGLEAVETDEL